MITTTAAIDSSLFLDINHFTKQTPELHSFFIFFANDGIVFFALFLLIGLIIAWKKANLTLMARAIWSVLGMLLALLINQPLVHFFHENRPFVDFSNIAVLVHHNADYGMPSDHATMAGAVTAGLFLVNPILGTISLIAGILLSFSRVYVAVHYPSQVFVGMISGALIVLVSYWIIRKPLAKLLGWVMTTRLKVLLADPKLVDK